MSYDTDALKAYSYSYQDSKVRPNWSIRRSTEERLREFVAARYGFMEKGMLGREVDVALNEHMRKFLKSRGIASPNRVAHTHINNSSNIIATTRNNRTSQKAIQLRDSMVRFLLDSGICKPPLERITHAMLKRAICAVEGVTDQRSIKGRITLLQSNSLIEVEDWLAGNYLIVYDKSSNLVSDSSGSGN